MLVAGPLVQALPTEEAAAAAGTAAAGMGILRGMTAVIVPELRWAAVAVVV
jgi:hypothetical protein